MDTIGTTANKIMVVIWVVLAVSVAFASILILWTPGMFLFVGLLLMSGIIFLMAFQRTEKYRFENDRFNLLVRILGLAAAISCAIAVPLIVATH
jgi:hypothetical protein